MKILHTLLFMICFLDAPSRARADYSQDNSIIQQNGTTSIVLPEHQLAEESLQIRTITPLSFLEWSEDNHNDAFTSLNKVMAVWEMYKQVNQNLVFGKIQFDNPDSFSWEIVPYLTTDNKLMFYQQQISVLWNVIFGGRELTDGEKVHQTAVYRSYFQDSINIDAQPYAHSNPNDPFSKSEVIERQRVLEGQLVNVLYDYAPMGFGGERLHFLIVPKARKVAFVELSADENKEAMSLTQKLITHFKTTREIQEAYLFHKTGEDAGQTVPHWHMHVILIANTAQGIFGKLESLKKMLFGSSPLSDEELKEKVTAYRSELSGI